MNFNKFLLRLVSKASLYLTGILLILYALFIPQYLATRALERLKTPLDSTPEDERRIATKISQKLNFNEELITNKPISAYEKPSKVKRWYTDSVGRAKCFKKSMVDLKTPCSSCVNFITIANKDHRWRSIAFIAKALRTVSTNLRMSQTCFRLHVYTNIPSNSSDASRLAFAGGTGVKFYPFPKFLPRNGYTDRDRWHELSRFKLDVVLLHMRHYGHKVVWTDLDTIVLTDFSCAYSHLSNFVISRNWAGHSMRGPDGQIVRIRDGYSVYGDLWMIDERMAGRIDRLEKMGMPAPLNDLQDYFAFMLNLCDGTVTDLRGYFEDERNSSMCMGFDYAGGHHPTEMYRTPMNVSDGDLYCSVIREGSFEYHKFASMSFTLPLFQMYLRDPRLLFNNNELGLWSQAHGFLVSS